MNSSDESHTSAGDPLEGIDSETSRHPQSMYKMLRDNAPAFRKEGTGVIVSRRADVDQILRTPDLFSSGMHAAALGNIRPLIPLQIDPPDHRKFRKLLDPTFAPQRMRELEQQMVALVNELIDSFIDRDEIDFVAEFSLPFPSQVFLTMLGLPLDELPRLLEMKDGIIRPHVKLGTTVRDPAADALRRATGLSIYEYFDEVIAGHSPGDNGLLGGLLEAELEGERLTHEEVLDICFLFLIAGLDTVSASLECFFRFLAEHPDRRSGLSADPAVIPDLVEELLRWETPVAVVSRVATEDTEIAGCPVQAGEQVLALLGSANTDEAELPDAGDVRWNRDVNRHLAFGGGIHRCLGSHLARLELRVALREWHARIPDYRVAPGADLAYAAGVRSLETFPMILEGPA